jgi:hypothetical protein
MTDSSNLCEIMARVKPHEIYNLAAQSHVKVRSTREPIWRRVTPLATDRETCQFPADTDVSVLRAQPTSRPPFQVGRTPPVMLPFVYAAAF